MKKFLSTTKGSSRHYSTTKQTRVIVALGALCVALFYLVPKVLFWISAVLMMPIISAQAWLGGSTSAIPQFFRDRSDLISEIRDLEQKLHEQKGDEPTLELFRQENEDLHALLSDDGTERIVAGVIARPNQIPYDVLILDRGSEDGVKIGAPVFAGANSVIGYVHKTTASTALVTLITTPDFVSTVFVFGPDIYTNAVGQGGGQVRIGVPQGISLSEGDLVVLPSVRSGVYGTVTHVESSPTQPEQYGYVSPPISLQGLHLVAVGTEPLLGTDFETASRNVEAQYSDLFTVPVPEDRLVSLGNVASTSTSTDVQAEGVTTDSATEEQ